MCGRFTQFTPVSALADFFQARAPAGAQLPPRYNVCPTQPVVVVRETPAGRRLGRLRWGLVPPWSKGPGSGPLLINARIETAAEKPAFREALRRARCIVPADGFYEWAPDRRPHYFRRADGRPLALAGLWARWEGPDGQVLGSFTILTTAADAHVEAVHSRMPVVVPDAAFAAWLAPDRPDGLAALARAGAFSAAAITSHPVDARVGSARVDEPELIAVVR